MSPRKLTWIAGVGAALIAIVLIVRYGVTTTHAGADHEASSATGAKADYTIEDAPDGGRTVDSTSGRLKAWLPGYPYPTNQNVDSPYGSVAFHAFSDDGPRISCTVSWSDRGPTDVRTDAQLFEETGRMIATTVDGKVLAQRDTSLGSYVGKDLQLSAAKPRVGSYRVRVYVVGPRLYTMTVFMMPGAELDADIDRFFESLTVTSDDAAVLHVAPPPPPVRPDTTDVYVSMTQESPPGTFRTLLVHEDGTCDLVVGRDGPVARRTAKGIAKLASLKRIFDGPAWRALPESPANGASSMYAIASGGRTIHRSDPLTTVEPAFVDALGALGELWIYAERADRPKPL
jgi:hypothetical protein